MPGAEDTLPMAFMFSLTEIIKKGEINVYFISVNESSMERKSRGEDGAGWEAPCRSEGAGAARGQRLQAKAGWKGLACLRSSKEVSAGLLGQGFCSGSSCKGVTLLLCREHNWREGAPLPGLRETPWWPGPGATVDGAQTGRAHRTCQGFGMGRDRRQSPVKKEHLGTQAREHSSPDGGGSQQAFY